MSPENNNNNKHLQMYNHKSNDFLIVCLHKRLSKKELKKVPFT